MPNYGSGTLLPWANNAHGIIGNLATAHGLILGDSITTLGREELAAAFAVEGKTLAVNYHSGRPTTPAIDWLLEQTVLPADVIIACGTNDIQDPSVMTEQIERVLAAELPGCQRLFWVTVQACRPAYDVADQRNSGFVNAQIRDLISDDRFVIDWDVWFASDPARFPRYLQVDGVHPINGVGTNFWAAVIMLKLKAAWNPVA